MGDIVTGPFLAYGLDCEDKDMLRLVNGVHSKRTADIAERNVYRMMHELLFRQPFNPSR
jgi:dynein assembly factor 3